MLKKGLQTGMKVEPIHLNTLGNQPNGKACNTIIKNPSKLKDTNWYTLDKG